MKRIPITIMTGLVVCCALVGSLIMSTSAFAGTEGAFEVESEGVFAKSTEATLEAQVNTGQLETMYSFEYSSKVSGGVLQAPVMVVSGDLSPGGLFGETPVSVSTGPVLKAGETYYYRVVLENARGKVEGGVQSFTTVPIPYTDAVTDVTSTTAMFHGHLALNPLLATRYSFDYSLTGGCANGRITTPVEATAASESTPVTGLEPNATYAVCFVTSNAFGSEVDPTVPPVQFTTLPASPKIDGESASGVVSTRATLEAQVNPNNEETGYDFEYAASKKTVEEGNGTKVPGASSLKGGTDQTASVPTGLLQAGETYYYRVVAKNEQSEKEVIKQVEGGVESFTTVAVPHTEDATEITATTAKLNGTLTPLNPLVNTEYLFDYHLGPEGTECTNESATPAENAGTSGTPKTVPVFTDATNLQPDQVYSVCLLSMNLSGSEADPATPPVSFKTLAAPATVISESVSGVKAKAVTLEALINPNNQETTYEFEYSTAGSTTGNMLTGTIEKTPGSEPLSAEYNNERDVSVSTTQPPPVSEVLAPGTTYYYRVSTRNATGEESKGAVEEFTTIGRPSATTGEVGNTTRTNATLSGTVNPGGAETEYYFEYISEAGYRAALAKSAADPYAEGETTTPMKLTENGATDVSFTPVPVGPIPAAGLRPGTPYHYRLVASNEAGIIYGEDHTFTTLAGTPPIVTTGGVSDLSQNTATLSGTVGTNSLQTEYGFEIGTEPGDYGPVTGLGSLSGALTQVVSVTLGELQPATTYYYRVTATNADGTIQGEPQSFATPGFPTLISTPGSLPLVATPVISFPTVSLANTATGAKTKTLTNKEKLAKALRACHAKKGKKRSSCEAAARAKYRQASKKKGAMKRNSQSRARQGDDLDGESAIVRGV
jgi:hypothetical protein